LIEAVISPFVGNLNWKVAPRSTLFVAHSLPPWEEMMERQTARPNPNP
jgi:hypothetical protein